MESSDATPDDGSPPARRTRTTPDVKKMVLGGLSTLLKVAKEASSPLPPLQTALGAVIACLEIYSVSDRFLEDLERADIDACYRSTVRTAR